MGFLKRRLPLWLIPLVLLAALAGGCAGYQDAEPGEQVVTTAAPSMAYALIQENEDNPDFVILDVRTPEEYAEGHLAGSVLLDFYAADFEEKLAGLDRDKIYLVYCRSGNRSGQAADLMEEMGFLEVYDMGGINQWTAEGLPAVK